MACGGAPFQTRAGQHEDVEPAVIVIIEKCDAGPGSFDEVTGMIYRATD